MLFMRLLCFFVLFVPIIASAQWTAYTPSTSGTPSTSTSHIIRDPDGGIWVSTYDGIGKYNGGNWENYTSSTSNSPFDSTANDYSGPIMIDSQGFLWVCTRDGYVFKYDRVSEWTNYGITINTQSNAIIEDLDGNIWVGGIFGIDRFDGANWVEVNNSFSVYSFDYDSKGNFWIGSNLGLIMIDGDSNIVTFSTSNSPLMLNTVKAVVVGKDDEIYASVDGAIYEFNLTDSIWVTYSSVSGSFISPDVGGFVVDANGNIYGAGNSRMVVKTSGGTSWSGVQYPYLPDFFTVGYAITIDNDGYKWIGVQEGQLQYNTAGSGPLLKTASVVTDLNIDVYPNPLEDVLHISFRDENVYDVNVTLIDIVGNHFELVTTDSSVFGKVLTVPLEEYNLKPGCYLAVITTNHGNEIVRLLLD